MASKALTCLKDRACQPNASPPTYLKFHNTKKNEEFFPPRFKHCADQYSSRLN